MPHKVSPAIVAEKVVDYQISHTHNGDTISGHFSTKAQARSLQDVARGSSVALKILPISIDRARKDYGSIDLSKTLIPVLAQGYTVWQIDYQNKTLEVSGKAKSEKALSDIRQLISHTHTPTKNLTTLDKVYIKKRAEEEAARKRAAQEAAAKKRAEEEAARLAAEKKRAEEEVAKQKFIDLLKMENIEFNVNKSSLTSIGENTVDKISTILKSYPDIKIEIAGHTDSDGNKIFNQRLSQARVDAVKNTLIELGISPDRVIAKGYGESRPLVPNTSRENKRKNRRVEIHIIGE